MHPTRLLGGCSVVIVFCVYILALDVQTTVAQQSFELPVELVGFPVIIMAVRLSNFVKKLAYSLNPRTYMSRTRRAIEGAHNSTGMIDMQEAEKRLVAELGENVCIYTRVCLHHAAKARKSRGNSPHRLDWNGIFSHYKASPDRNKEFYLLSVFLGDIVASPHFCNQLAKRGRQCID